MLTRLLLPFSLSRPVRPSDVSAITKSVMDDVYNSLARHGQDARLQPPQPRRASGFRALRARRPPRTSPVPTHQVFLRANPPARSADRGTKMRRDCTARPRPRSPHAASCSSSSWAAPSTTRSLNFLSSKPYMDVPGKLSFSLEDLLREEHNAGLDHGGMGRLAACCPD